MSLKNLFGRKNKQESKNANTKKTTITDNNDVDMNEDKTSSVNATHCQLPQSGKPSDKACHVQSGKNCAKVKSLRDYLVKIGVSVFVILGILAGVVGVTVSKNELNNEGDSDSVKASSSNVISNLWDSTNGKFSVANLNSVAKLINTNYNDIYDLVADTGFSDGTITKKASDMYDSGGNECTIKFGEYTYNGTTYELEWIPVYLSSDDNGDPILTLWLASTDTANGTLSDQEIDYWCKAYQQWSSVVPASNNYSTSYIATFTLNNGGDYYTANSNTFSTSSAKSVSTITPTSDGTNKFEIFTTGVLSGYIVAPEKVSWQVQEDYCVNDISYTDPSGHHWNDGWKDDLLWLPSVYEIGDSSISHNSQLGYTYTFTVDGGMWGTSVDQRSNNKETSTRSAAVDYSRSGYNDVDTFQLLTTGGIEYGNPSEKEAIRPCLHLNLKSAAGLPTPTSSKDKTYNGSAFTVVTAFKDATTWYDSAVYPYSSKISCTFEQDGKTVSALRAGTYTAKITIVSGSNVYWADGADITKAKEVTFTIKKKNFEVEFKQNTTDYSYTATAKASTLANTDTGSPPTLTVQYSGDGYPASDKVPTMPGTYTVEALLDPTDANNMNDNYQLSGTTTTTFTIPPIQVTIPSITNVIKNSAGNYAKQYSSTFQEFVVQDYDSTNSLLATDSGLTYDATNSVLKAKDLGTYAATFSLKNTTQYVWVDNAGAVQSSTDPIILNIQITEKELTLTYTLADGDNAGSTTLAWEKDKDQKISITHDGFEDGITFSFSYEVNGTTYPLGSVSKSGKTITGTISAISDQGSYTLTATLQSAAVNSINKNYKLGSTASTTFAIGASAVTIDLKTLQWQYQQTFSDSTQATGTRTDTTNVGASVDSNGTAITKTIYYDGVDYVFGIDTSTLPAGVKVDHYEDYVQKLPNVNNSSAGTTYTAKAYIVAADSDHAYSGTNPLTYTFVIEKGLFDLTDMDWDYLKAFTYDGSSHSVTLKTNNTWGGVLPKGLEVDKYSDNDKTDAGTYTAYVTFKLTDSNYILPVQGKTNTYTGTNVKWEFKWQIDKATISLDWKDKTTFTCGNGTVLSAPAITFDNQDWLVYTVYKYDSSKPNNKGDQIDFSTLNLATGSTIDSVVEVTFTTDPLYAANIANYQLDPNGVNPNRFSLGDTRKEVLITINGSYTYGDGKTHEPTITITGTSGYKVSDLTYTYYDSKGNKVLASSLENADTYTMKFELKSGDEDTYVIPTAYQEIKFTVAQKVISVAGVKWDYDPTTFIFTLEKGASGTTAKVWKPVLSTLDPILEAAVVYYDVSTGVATGTVENGKSAVGKYTIAYDFSNLSSNYAQPVFDSGVTQQLSWEVKTREFTVPSQTAIDVTFTGQTIDFAKLAGLPTDWDLYLEVQVAKKDNVSILNDADASTYALKASARDVGNYVFTLYIKSDLIDYTDPSNVVYSATWTGYSANGSADYASMWYNINPLIITVSGWKGKPATAVLSTSDSSVNLKDFVETQYYNGSTKITAEEAKKIYATPLTAELKALDSTKAKGDTTDNSNVKFIAPGETYSATLVTTAQLKTTFTIPDPSSTPIYLAKPDLTKNPAEFTYTGNALDIAQYFNSDFSSTYMQIMVTGPDVNVTEVGEYTVYVTLDPNANGGNLLWTEELGSTDDGTETLEFTFKIVPSEIAEKWVFNRGLPEIEGGYSDSVITYTFTDSTGATLTGKPSTSSYGQTFTVVAKIPTAMQNNCIFNDGNGNTSYETQAFTFTYEAPKQLATPTFEESALAYSGAAQAFTLQDADTTYVEYDSSVLTQTDVGKYKLTVKIKQDAYATWADGTTSDLELEFEITKGVVTVKWDESGHVPVLELNGQALPSSAVTYDYYDEAGNPVDASEMVNQTNYTVVASMSDEYAAEYMFEDSLSSLTNPEEFLYEKYTMFFGLIEVSKDFPVWQFYLILFCLLVSIFCYVKGTLNMKKNRKLMQECEEKREDDGDEVTYAHGGLIAGGMVVLQMLAAGGSMIWTIIAGVAVVIMLVGVIYLIISTKKQGALQKDLKDIEKDKKKKALEAEKKKAEEERKRLEKEEKEEERKRIEEERRQKEEREAEIQRKKEEREEQERERREEREAQREAMMMQRMNMGGGSGGGGGNGGGGGGIMPMPYPMPSYSQPPVQTVQAAPAQPAQPQISTEDIVAKVVAAINPTLQAQQQQVQQLAQQQQIQQQIQQQFSQQKQDDKVKALEEQLAQHKQDQVDRDKFAQQQQLTQQQIDQRVKQRLAQQQASEEADEQARLVEIQQKQLANMVAQQSNQAARETEEKKKQESDAQMRAFEERIQQQEQLIAELKAKQEPAETETDKANRILEMLQNTLKEQIQQQSKDQTRLLEEQLQQQSQLIEELKAKQEQAAQEQAALGQSARGQSAHGQAAYGQAAPRTENSAGALDQLQSMLQQQIAEQQRLHLQQQEQANMLERQIQQQKQEQARAMEQQTKAQTDQQMKALEAQIEQQKADYSKLLEQQKREQEQRDNQLRQEQEQKFAQQQAELQLKQQEQIKALEQQLKAQQAQLQAQQVQHQQEMQAQQAQHQQEMQVQQAQLQAQQAQHQQEMLAQQQAMRDQQLAQQQQLQAQQAQHQQELHEQQVAHQQEQAQQQIKNLEAQLAQQKEEQEKLKQEQEKRLEELKAQSVATVPPTEKDEDKTTKILEQQSKTLEQQTELLNELRAQSQVNQTKPIPNDEDKTVKILEQQAQQQAELLNELRAQSQFNQTKPAPQPVPEDDKTTKILEQQSKTLEQIAQQQAELQAEQKAHAQQQAELQAQQKAQEQRQAELQAQQKAQEQAEQQRALEEQIREQARQIDDLRARQGASPQEDKTNQILEEHSKLLAELRAQRGQVPVTHITQDNGETNRILEQQNRTLEQQGRTLEQQGRTLEQLSQQVSQQQNQQAQRQADLQNQQRQAELQAQQLAQKQAELQAQQLAQRQAELQAQQLAERQAKLLEQQAQTLAQQQLQQPNGGGQDQDELAKKNNLTKK